LADAGKKIVILYWTSLDLDEPVPEITEKTSFWKDNFAQGSELDFDHYLETGLWIIN